MKNALIVSLAVASGFVACKSREFNSDEQSVVNKSTNARFTFGPVFSNDNQSGWCYFNHDTNFKGETKEYTDPETLERFRFVSRDLVKKTDGFEPAHYSVLITLHRYTKAHPYALDFDQSRAALQKGQLGRSSSQINMISALSGRLGTYQNRAALRVISGELCSIENLNAAGQLNQIAQALDPANGTAARLESTCKGQPVGVEKEYDSAELRHSADYQWLRKTVEGITAFNSNLSCPSEYYEFEVSKGKFLRWAH